MIQFLINWLNKKIEPDFRKIIKVIPSDNWVNIVKWCHTTYPIKRPIKIDWKNYECHGQSWTYLELTFFDNQAYAMYQITWGSY